MNPTVKSIFGFLAISLSVLSCAKAPAIEGMVYIPPGEFIMGSEEVDTEALGTEFGLRTGRYYDDEKPMSKVFLDGYYMDKYEVTNARYEEFITVTAAPAPPYWTQRAYPEGKASHPVTNVTWYSAGIYCAWAGKRLPTEAEWEKAARGPGGNKYPWGNEYDEKKANLFKGETVPVGSFETDKSYYGVYDMGGNVMEWTNDWYDNNYYPFMPKQNPKGPETGKYRSVRGSAFIGGGNLTDFRNFSDPDLRSTTLGFRCAK